MIRKVGVLALQGAYEAHLKMVACCGREGILIKKPEDLHLIDALILPGGESTTQTDLLSRYNFHKDLKDFINRKKKIFGTCAGVILLQKFEELDIEVKRNAYGSQKDSFETLLEIPSLGQKPFEGIFIRAPQILSVSKKINILATFNSQPVLIEQENILAATFHPELTNDKRIHEYFLS